MGTRTANWYPVPGNWNAVTAAGGWSAQGPASFIPTLDDDNNTRVCYTWLGLDNYKPSSAILSLNCLHSLNTDASSVYKNPVLADGESWSRYRVVVVYGAPHPSFSTNLGEWSMRIKNWTTTVAEFSPSYNSDVLYYGVWSSKWQAGGVPDLFNLDVTPNRMFNEGAQTNFDKWSAVWGIAKIYIQQEITTPDPVYPPEPSFTASQVLATLQVNTDATQSKAGSGTISGYEWTWGDGSAVTTGVTSSHAYASAGTYTITLKVTNSENLWKETTKTQVISSIPGTGGMPEVPDPDPTPPPPITPPSLPPTDMGVAWYPVAKQWATDFTGWLIAAPGESAATASTPPLTLIDRRMDTGVRVLNGPQRKMVLHFPLTDDDVMRDPLPSGKEFKRIKLLVIARNDSFGQDQRTWSAVLKSAGNTIATVTQAVGGTWESDWVSMSALKTDALADGLTVELADTSGDSLLVEARVHVEYGDPGTTLPAPPIHSDDYISALPGSVHLRVVPAAAGLPSPSGTLDATSGSMPPAGQGTPDPIANNIENGVALPFGFGIGGYGLDVGCIDGNGVEWWLTDVEGWDEGMNAELTVIDPELGTGTFVNNVAARGREVVVSGVLFSHNASALLSAKRKLAGCLSEPPHIGWMVARDTMLPVALNGSIRVDQVSRTRVDFEASFRGVRAPYSLGMGVWREGKFYERTISATSSYIDYPQTGSTPMTPIITAVGPIAAGARIDAVSLGATYRSGGFVLEKAIPSGASITINCILRRVTMTGTNTTASDYINWEGSRWMYLDARGCRVLTSGSGSGSWRLVSRELW